MHQVAETLTKAGNKQKEYYDRRAKENAFKIGDLMLYKNQYRTKFAKKWYTYYRIARKHGDLTFTIQHNETEIEKKVPVYNIQLVRGQTEWNIDPTWFRGRRAKYTYYSTDFNEKKSTNDTSVSPDLSVTSTDFEDQSLAELKKF